LTQSQRSAVEHAGSPLIVLAGPGTGKTRVITHRIAHMIRERGVSPEKILAVTFTVKAANQLRERLGDLVGASAASLSVHTFNGLGMRMIQRHAGALGLGANVTLIDEAQASRLLQEVILKHGLFRETRGMGLGAIAAELLPRFESFATHGAAPAKCAALLEAWKSWVPDEAAASDEAMTEREQFGRFEQETRAYQAYTAERLRRGWLTYNDQVLLPIQLLKERPGVAATYRTDFAHVVVDEFQDCNEAQIELLALFAGRTTHDICVVGDDDQSIYGFRGADDQAFARFEKQWPNATVVALEENWRSSPPIVKAAGAIIAKAGRRFRPDKTITSPTVLTTRPGCVEAVGLRHDFEDGDTIRDILLTEKATREAAGEPMPWGSFAVIARTHTDLERIGGSLTLAGIPIDRVREQSLLTDDGVEDVLAWAGWIVNAGATVCARRLLVRPPTLLALQAAAALENTHRAAKADGATTLDFATWLETGRGVTDGASELAKLRRELAATCAALTGEKAIDAIIARTDPAHNDMLPGRERSKRVRALVSFVSLVRDKQHRLQAPGDLGSLLEHIELLRDLKAFKPTMGLGDVDGDVVESSEGADGASHKGRVQLMTAHQSKGLEFDTVFVPRVSPGHGYPKSKGNNEPEPLPPGLVESLDERPEAERRADEERRVFYVACTRAERRLVLLAKKNKSASKSTHFFEELTRGAAGVLPRTPEEIATAAEAAGLRLPSRWLIDPSESEDPAELISRLRRQAREQAASALHAAEGAAPTPELLEASSRQLASAARRLAVLAELARTGEAPGWLEPGEDVKGLVARMKEAREASGIVIRPMKGPLSLSYSMLRAFERCPRCFYLERVLGLREPSRGAAEFGSVVHQVLHEYFDEWRLADAEGQTPPGVERARELALRHEAAQRAGETPPDKAVIDQILAQVETAATKLHAATDHILELERDVRFEYVIDGVAHRFEAKIDRLDGMPDGRRRIVDYKTGEAYKSLREVAKDDLQMGVYALALAHLDGTPDAPPPGEAEYWLLSSGQRGRIDLADLDLPKVRGKIDEAARKMLAGEFEVGKNCTGLCRSLLD
jgi:DNA helicase-2/ATP-dependent DNA helicase PcrA